MMSRETKPGMMKYCVIGNIVLEHQDNLEDLLRVGVRIIESAQYLQS